ncbi:GAF domain-containing protein [Paractinoplanes abujensis]|uniref:GAF domain-containing protein n=1 Tax=Paractinoplanes abujensis TaxID=882441 RepID=A0A7W7CTZ1_9ACTN|nr:GAF domain-containing protein [Actinoplanes abujensis]MBB4693335.1 GAF domain-containing protein [Actinoplanes abujensis]
MSNSLSTRPSSVSPCGTRLLEPARLVAVAAALSGLHDKTATGLSELVDALAGTFPGATVALNLIWTNNSFVLASHGMPEWIVDAGGVPIGWAPCALVVKHDSPLIIDDTHDDPAHMDNPIVTVCGVRSYAGVPLHDTDGHLVGTLILMHTEPRAFKPADLPALTTAAAHATTLLSPSTGV